MKKCEKSKESRTGKYPRGMSNIYGAAIEKRWASHAHKN
nr:MAG TPA: hypothetical protein [Caudoviricetes sp.]